MRDADRKRVEFASLDTAARVARRLVELAERFGEPEENGVRITVALSQDELAGWVGLLLLGQLYQRTMPSHLLGGGGTDATVLAREIAARHRPRHLRFESVCCSAGTGSELQQASAQATLAIRGPESAGTAGTQRPVRSPLAMTRTSASCWEATTATRPSTPIER